MLPEQKRLVPRRRRVFSVLTSIPHAGLAIDRGNLAGPQRLDAGTYFLDRLLENQAAGAAVWFIANAARLLPIAVLFVVIVCRSVHNHNTLRGAQLCAIPVPAVILLQDTHNP